MSGPMEWKLTRIRSTYLGIEDHGFLTFTLQLDYADPGQKIGGSSQGFGQHALWTEARGGTKESIAIIARILQAVGVEQWEHLKGQMVWAQAEHTAVHRIKGLETGIICDPAEIFNPSTP